ncbi:MAG TPA: MerR family transcriptional regulator [Candidatus Hydrogenedentes bacterium]|nr:MerR family transcriptional regulator [Candidatus Hydrogenedentota bacterium]HOJ68661.1 MerR family transcriptional regulator [Candidatus Hydrogenedentota bacterium]HOK90354.1 MerR family transcriptional regulator [Candidatus Hydrogenedentota bacterium]HOV60377.1 MerR family transcriptional regulator [Candidatus Hydrogenedentota bacterium]
MREPTPPPGDQDDALPISAERRYSIGEVAELTGLPVHTLRSWERQFPGIRVRRTHSGRRYYLKEDIELFRRIRTMLTYEGLSRKGVRQILAEERAGMRPPRLRQEAQALADAIAEEARALLDLLGSAPPAEQAGADEGGATSGPGLSPAGPVSGIDNIEPLFPGGR